MRDRRAAAGQCIKCGSPHDGNSRRRPGQRSKTCHGCVDYMLQNRRDKADASEGVGGENGKR